MRVFAKWIIGLTVFLAAAVFIASQFISTQFIVDQLSTKVQAITGRQLTVSDDTKLSVFPSLALELNNIKFSNLASSKNKNMVVMDKLTVHIPWLSLFSKQLTIDKFVFEQPKFFLERDANGQANWVFNQTKAAPVESPKNSKPNVPSDFDLNFGQVELINGSVSFFDGATNKETNIDQLNIKMLLPSLTQPIELAGELRYMADNITVNAKIDSLDSMMNKDTFDTVFNASSSKFIIDYTGNVANGGQKFSGDLKVKADSIQNLLAWQNIKLAVNSDVLQKLELSSHVKFDNNVLTLEQLAVNLDELMIKGRSDITLSSPISVQANVDLGKLNITPYLNKNEDTSVANNDTKEELKPQQPIVWDKSIIDLSAFNDINLDILIKSTSFILNDIKLGKNKFALKLKSGNAVLKLEEFNAYNGKGVGSININAQSTPYRVSSEFTLSDINAEPLLSDVIGFNKVLGKGGINWQINSQGRSQSELISNLTGTLNLAIKDGAVKGVNLGALARSAQNLMTGNFQGIDLDKNFVNSEKTDFASLTADFKIKDGNATTDNLALVNPFVRVQGNGDINLPATKINMKLETKLVATSEGQASKEQASGVSIPIKVSGPFHDVKFKPDVSSKAKDKLKEKVKDKLKGLFG